MVILVVNVEKLSEWVINVQLDSMQTYSVDVFPYGGICMIDVEQAHHC